MRKQAQAWTVLLALSVPAAARAQEGDVDAVPERRITLDVPHDPLELGFKNIAYTFGLKAAGVSDDNVLLTADNEESDWITILLFSVEGVYKRDENEARLSYRGRDRQYARNDELSGMEHFVDGSGVLRFRGWRLEGGGEWRATKDTFDELAIPEPIDSRYDREYLRVGAEFNRLDLSFTVEHSGFAVDHETHDRGDYDRLGFAVLAGARAWPQAEAFAELRVRSTDYDENVFSDFTYYRLALGAKGTFTAKLTGEARIGYGQTVAGDDGVVAAEDYAGLILDATARWEVNETNELSATFLHEPAESVLVGLAVNQAVHLAWRYRVSEKVSFRTSIRWSREAVTGGGESRWGLATGAGARWESGHGLYADAGVLVRQLESDDPAAEYDNVRISFGLGVEW